MQHMRRECPELAAQVLWSISVTLAERLYGASQPVDLSGNVIVAPSPRGPV
jgi:hypothetical protein